MNSGAKLAGYGLVLVAMVGAGAAVGDAVGPVDVGDGSEHTADHEGTGTRPLPAGGLLVSQDGFTLATGDRVLAADTAQPFAFVIEGPDGHPVERYDLRHERELHLIVVSADLARFAHLHPQRATDGTWSIELPPLAPGAYRAFADFQAAGAEPLTLGTDLVVPGEVTAPRPLTERRHADVDGYEVTIDGDLTPGAEATVTVTVRRGGRLVVTEPYLGAAGHLVAIRDGDLAYLHVHPLDDTPAGPVRFAMEVPSAGTYGLFVDFAHDGTVHTAAFTVEAGHGIIEGAHP